MGRSKAAKRRQIKLRQQQTLTKWSVLMLNGEASAAAEVGMTEFWAKDAIAAAKKVFRQSKAASKITIASSEGQKFEFDVTAFSLTQERKRTEFRRRSGLTKLDQAMELLEL